jgi:hypothetical protein
MVNKTHHEHFIQQTPWYKGFTTYVRPLYVKKRNLKSEFLTSPQKINKQTISWCKDLHKAPRVSIAFVYAWVMFTHCFILSHVTINAYGTYTWKTTHLVKPTFKLTSLPWVNLNLQVGGTTTHYKFPKWSNTLSLRITISRLWA